MTIPLPGFAKASPVAASTLKTLMARAILWLGLLFSASPGWHTQRSWMNALSQRRPAFPEVRKFTAAAPSATLVCNFACTRGVRREEDGLVELDAGVSGGCGPSITSRGRFRPRVMGACGRPGASNASDGWLVRVGVQVNVSGLVHVLCPILATPVARTPAVCRATMVGEGGVVNPSPRCGCGSLRSRLLVSSL